jgi:hypothetical protein
MFTRIHRYPLIPVMAALALAFQAPSHAGEPVGPCCIVGGVGGCYETTRTECEAAGNVFRSAGLPCILFPECYRGACCVPEEGVCIMTYDEDCALREGDFHGTGSRCEQFICPLPTTGACCSGPGCFWDLQWFCGPIGGTPMGLGTFCEDYDCADGAPPMGGCCQANGNCVINSQIGCERHGDVYLGDNTNCDSCQALPRGACCLPDESCVFTWDFKCIDAGGAFHGLNTVCASVDCTATACPCPGDTNGDSAHDGSDVEAFAACIIGQSIGSPPTTGCECADANNDNAADINDIAAFVAMLLTAGGCP